MDSLVEETDAEERARLLRRLAARMQRNLAEVRGGTVEAERLAKDIDFCTEGRISTTEVLRALQTS